MQCRVKVGQFLVRECKRFASKLCCRCNRAVCDSHVRHESSKTSPSELASKVFVCFDCLKSDRLDGDHDGDSDSSSRSSSSSSSTSISGQGGSFGGAGASGSWAAPGSGANQGSGSAASLGALPIGNAEATDSASEPLADGFTAEDEALFDEVQSFDSTTDSRETYDS